MTKRKPRTPYFVSVKLTEEGEVEMVTDEGDVYHCEMRDDSRDGWPIISRLARWRDQFDYGVKKKKEEPPKPDGPPKLVWRKEEDDSCA